MGIDDMDKMPRVEIAPATPEDAQEIQQLTRDSWLATYPNEELGITREDIEDLFKDWLTPEAIQKAAQELTDREAGGINFVAKINNKVVGYCRLRENADENLLTRMYVAPDKKQQRIGTMLWEQVQTVLNPQKDTALWVADYNQNAIDVYRKWGFFDTGVREDDPPMKSGAHRTLIKMLRPKVASEA